MIGINNCVKLCLVNFIPIAHNQKQIHNIRTHHMHLWFIHADAKVALWYKHEYMYMYEYAWKEWATKELLRWIKYQIYWNLVLYWKVRNILKYNLPIVLYININDIYHSVLVSVQIFCICCERGSIYTHIQSITMYRCDELFSLYGT